MRVFDDVEAFREACSGARGRGHRVGLVPTMGALHEGHLALVGEARSKASWVAASVFVNPTQFGPNEDFDRYPRDLEGDLGKLEAAGCDAVFTPPRAAMYPAGDAARVRVARLTEVLCGPHRPGHFEGVATVVTKLFAITGPSVAVFGKKDYQQLQVIKRLVRDLFLPIEIVGYRTVREADGLAMSSRNRYLSAEARQQALSISRGLRRACELFAAGERGAGVLRAAVREPVAAVATSIDYVEVAHPDELSLYADSESVGPRALIAVAMRLGGTRLIDNVVLGEDPTPGAAASEKA